VEFFVVLLELSSSCYKIRKKPESNDIKTKVEMTGEEEKQK